MEKKLALIVCNFLVPEVSELIRKGDYPDVKLMSFPAICGANSVLAEQIEALVAASESAISDTILIHSICGQTSSNEYKKVGIKEVRLNQCFELFVNQEIAQHYVSQGYYLVSSGWLKRVEENISNWGFEGKIAQTFFGGSMKGILMLDTQISFDFMPRLIRLSEYMGLPYEILPVGLSHCKMFIDSVVFNWRSEREQLASIKRISEISRQNADYTLVYNKLDAIINLLDESEIVNVGFELLNVLFAPSQLVYSASGKDAKDQVEFKGFYNCSQLSEDNCFHIDIYHSGDLLGIFYVKGIQFPQFITEYNRVGKLVSQIFGLAIANARKYCETIEQNQKLESFSSALQKTNHSKDIFFSIIAHDLRGPFNALLGISKLLGEEIEKGDMAKIEKFSSILDQTLNNTYGFILNLLEWSKAQSGGIDFAPQTFLLRGLVDEVIGLLSSQSGLKRITLNSSIPSNLEVFADPNMVSTLIRNLVSNAIKYNREDGSVNISAHKSESMLIVSVEDTGLGIRPQQLDKLFKIESAESTPGTANEQGTGLGLLLCKEFVEIHKGRIWVESEEGKGSVFHFTIPLSKSEVSINS